MTKQEERKLEKSDDINVSVIHVHAQAYIKKVIKVFKVTEGSKCC